MAAWILLGSSCATAQPATAQPAEPNQLTAQERHDGWRLLFDGKTTAGWLEVTGKSFPSNCWTIENGSLKALVRTDGFQDIRTADSFRSFDLQFDWMLKADGNSGLKYLIQNVDEWVNKTGRQARARGLEYQLADNRNADAASDPRKVAGALYSLIAPWGRPPGLPGGIIRPDAFEPAIHPNGFQSRERAALPSERPAGWPWRSGNPRVL